MKKFFPALILFLLSFSFAQATHLYGGEIRATHVSGQTFRISVHVYLDATNQASTAMQSVNVCFGDGQTAQVPLTSTIRRDGSVSVSVFEKVYTYATGDLYQISTALSNRSGDILNLPNGDQSEMFLWTVLDTRVANNTPVLSYPDVEAGVKQVFTVDLKKASTESDSVSVWLQQVSGASPGTCGVRTLNYSYFFPNDLTKAGTFKVDNVAHKLTWTAPEKAGKYLYAFVVDEWRNGVVISQSYHENTVIVKDRPGETVAIPDYEPASTKGGLLTSNPIPDNAESTIRVSAYPVPTETTLNFQVNSVKQTSINVQLVNLQGQIVRETNSRNAAIEYQGSFDVRLLPKGVYLLRATNGVDSVVQKVIR